MKRLHLLLLPLLAMILTACPYVSQVPIANPNQVADKMVFGDWIVVNKDNSHGDEYSIAEHEDGLQKYRIDGPEAMYDAWISVVDKTWFLNICDPAKLSDGYLILRVDKMNFKTIELTPVSARDKKQFTQSPELAAWMNQHMTELFFYDEGEKIKLVRNDN